MDARVIEVAVAELVPAPWQRAVDEKSEKFKDLLAAVRADGVAKPLDVRPLAGASGDTIDGAAKYEVLDGGRRLRAAVLAGIETVPCIIHEGLSDAEACDLTYLAFLGREDLTPLQEGRAVEELLEQHGGEVEAVASVVGKSLKWVRMRANLGQLTKKWRKLAADPSLGWTAAHLAVVARLPAAVQEDLLDTEYGYEPDCDRTVKELDAMLNEKCLHLLSKASWALDDATLEPKMGACSACKQRSSQEGLLFHEADELEPAAVAATDKCLRADCWERKRAEYIGRRFVELKKEHKDLHVVAAKYLGYSEEKEAKKAFAGCTVLDRQSNFTRVSMEAKGAVPALTIAGDGAGELHWIKVEKQRAVGSGQRAAGPTPLKERRAKLEKRRAAKVIGDLRELLDPWCKRESAESKAGPPVTMVETVTAIAVFGIEASVARDPWALCTKLSIDTAERHSVLWCALAGTLDDLLGCALVSLGYHATPKDVLAEAKAVGKLCRLDVGALIATAKAEIPEPKSWAKLNSDGSVKKTVKAKKKPAKKKVAKKTEKVACAKCGVPIGEKGDRGSSPAGDGGRKTKRGHAADAGTPASSAEGESGGICDPGEDGPSKFVTRTLILGNKIRGRAAGQHDGVLWLASKGGKCQISFSDGKKQWIPAKLVSWKQ